MNPQERAQLIDDLLEGELSEADFLRLEAELSVDPAARRDYFDRLAISILLETEAEDREPHKAIAKPSHVQTSKSIWGILVAVAIVFLAAFLISQSGQNDNESSPLDQSIATLPVEEEATGFAVISGQASAVWEDRPALPNGSLLPPGELQLSSGVVEVELFSGVTVVIEGEARFAILSPLEMNVISGKVRAHVPKPAHGFKISTRAGEVVDLGTDFAVNVSEQDAEVHVIEGEIEWHPRADKMRTMTEGEAIRSANTGTTQAIVADGTQFVGFDDLHAQLTESRQLKHEQWQQTNDAYRNDPRLIALYQPGAEPDSARRIRNRSIAGTDAAADGAIVAANRSSDRWGTPTGAIDFSPAGSRVRVAIEGEYRSLTLLCWVKINSLDRWYNSLFLTDGHDLHEPHWQIMDDGRLFFSVKKRDVFDRKKGEKDKHIYYSPPFWDSSLSGRWLMIATVYDVDQRQVTHYLNGEQLSREAIPEEYLVEQVHIGNASLGNWGLPLRNEPRFAVRNFNGSMDEFALFNAALSTTEIEELYKRGSP